MSQDEASDIEAAVTDPIRSPVVTRPTFWGLVLTAFLLIALSVLLLTETCRNGSSGTEVCQSNFAWLKSSPPNEVGDTLAGFAGVLAFIWIVTSVILQSHELREQRNELRRMVAIQAEQARILTLELQNNEKIQADQFFRTLIDRFILKINQSVDVGLAWKVEDHLEEVMPIEQNFDHRINRDIALDGQFESFLLFLSLLYHDLHFALEENGIIGRPQIRLELLEAQLALASAIGLEGRLTNATGLMIVSLKLQDILNVLSAFLNKEELWEKSPWETFSKSHAGKK